MKRLFGYILVVLGASVVGAQGVGAAPEGTWVGATVSVQARGAIESAPVNGSTCAGRMQPILLEGDVLYREGCVYGLPGGTQVARYWDTLNGFLYAISFAGDTRYAGLTGVCERVARCAYSQSEDVFLLHHGYRTGHVIIQDFTKHLVRRDGLTRAYTFEYDEEFRYVAEGGLWSNSVGISENGRWAVVELLNYGFLRIDLRTLQTKRIIAPGVQYGYGVDPTFEVGISNDGRQVAIAGWNAGLDVYEISDGCGDELGENPQTHLQSDARACAVMSPERHELFYGVYMVQQPRFIGDGSLLSVIVLAANGYELALLSPSGRTAEASGGYIAFGDSFTSGEGEASDSFYLPGTNSTENRCHVSSRSYPHLVGERWGLPSKNAACSGARTHDVLATAQRQAGAGSAPSIISVSVGGNDIGFSDKLKACIMPDTCEWVSESRRRNGAAEIRGLFPKLTALLQQLKSAYPASSLLVVGYPEVINDAVGAPCDPLVGTLLNSEERRYMNEVVRYLNEVLRQAAYHEGTLFFDTSKSYEGARLCDDPPGAMNAIRLGDDIAPLSFAQDIKLIGAESFHPTPSGHRLVADRLIADYPAAPAGRCEDCQFDARKLEPSSYWTRGDDAAVATIRLIASSFLEKAHYTKGELMRLVVPVGVLPPGAAVNIELHSSPLRLGQYAVNDEGVLDVLLETTALPPGYHTVHITGQNAGGEAVDLYQAVHIWMASSPVAPSWAGLVASAQGAGLAKRKGSAAAARIDEGGTVLGLQDAMDSLYIPASLPLVRSLQEREGSMRKSSSIDTVLVVLVVASFVAGCVATTLLSRRKREG